MEKFIGFFKNSLPATIVIAIITIAGLITAIQLFAQNPQLTLFITFVLAYLFIIYAVIVVATKKNKERGEYEFSSLHRRLAGLIAFAFIIAGIILFFTQSARNTVEVAFNGSPTPSPTPTETPTFTLTPSQTPTLTSTATSTPTYTPTVTPSPTPTETPTITPSPTATPLAGISCLVFTSEQNSDGLQIYSMDLSSFPNVSTTQLTFGPGINRHAVWSPDGSNIAFISSRNDPGDPITCDPFCNWDIYIMNANGTNLQQVTNHPAGDQYPVWSPDGTQLAFESFRGGNKEIYVMNIDGSEISNLTNNSADDFHPDWSPDGSQITFMSERNSCAGCSEIYVMQADGSQQQRLTNFVNQHSITPIWSPNGEHIAFVSNPQGAPSDIYIMSWNGENITNLTNNPNHVDRRPDWSPDGTHLAFVSERAGNPDIYLIDVESGEITQLTNDDAVDNQPYWRPSGSTQCQS